MPNGQQATRLAPQGRHLPSLEEACTKCHFSFLSPSKPKGLEEFWEVIGVEFYRCHGCNARYVRCFGRTLERKERRDRKYLWVLTTVGLGLLLCGALAFGILKITHRGP